MGSQLFVINKPLKRCPWCKSLPEIRKDDITGYDRCCNYYVACTNKKCKVRPKTKYYNDIYSTPDKCINKAIKAWNDR